MGNVEEEVVDAEGQTLFGGGAVGRWFLGVARGCVLGGWRLEEWFPFHCGAGFEMFWNEFVSRLVSSSTLSRESRVVKVVDSSCFRPH